MGYEDHRRAPRCRSLYAGVFSPRHRVGDLTRIFLTKLEAMHIKAEPLLERIFRRRPQTNGYVVVTTARSMMMQTLSAIN